MPLRIGFDMDGVLADFAGAFREYGHRVCGPAETPAKYIGQRRLPGDQPETEEARQAAAEQEARDRIEHARARRRREDKIWQAIESTPDFWRTLKPLEEGAVARIHALMLRHRWEVFFITHAPSPKGRPYSARRSAGSSSRASISRRSWC